MIPATIVPANHGPDGYPTVTSNLQDRTMELIQTCLRDAPKPLQLQRMKHFNWLKVLLFQGLPRAYKSQDASQPWLMYWISQSFQLMGAGFDPATKQRAIDTVMQCQSPKGGFGGGPKQEPGLLPTYAAVSVLAIVGRPGPGGGWDQIDRQAMYQFFMSLKQPDGSFVVSRNAEVDIRGIYCLFVVATLLDMLTPELIAGVPSFIASIQTYEGGFAASSQPFFDLDGNLMDKPRPAMGEAHGGYTGCAVGAWGMLRPLLSEEEKKMIDLNKLLRWLVMMQGDDEDGGGFRGRSNKLVDGCYSWWVAGSLSAVTDMIDPHEEPEEAGVEKIEIGVNEDDWADQEEGFFNNRGLQTYILGVAQDPAGGLRDKPKKPSDLYHTLYCLAGLSAAQHRVYHSKRIQDQLLNEWRDTTPFVPESGGGETTDEERNARRKKIWASSRAWKEDETTGRYLGGKVNRVNATHPLFTLIVTHSDLVMNHFYGQS